MHGSYMHCSTTCLNGRFDVVNRCIIVVRATCLNGRFDVVNRSIMIARPGGSVPGGSESPFNVYSSLCASRLVKRFTLDVI